MDTETTETVVPTETGAGEAVQDEVVTLSKAEYEKLNQTLGSLKRENKDLKKPREETPTKKTTDGLDYGMKAFLKGEGVESDHLEWVQSQRKESGMEIEALLKNPYFQAELKTRRDAASIKEAMPGETRGSGENPKSGVDYWVNKGELPPDTPDNRQLRRDVVNKKIEVERNHNRFSTSPVVHGQ